MHIPSPPLGDEQGFLFVEDLAFLMLESLSLELFQNCSVSMISPRKGTCLVYIKRQHHEKYNFSGVHIYELGAD